MNTSVANSSSVVISQFGVPVTSSFSFGSSTNLSAVNDLTNVSNFVLETSKGKIKWVNNLDVAGLDLDSNILFGDSFVMLNLANLNVGFNSSANVSMDLSSVGASCSAFKLFYSSSFQASRSALISGGRLVATASKDRKSVV